MSVWVRFYLCTVLLYASVKCQEDCIQTMPRQPEECVYQDHEGHKYDLTSIRNDNRTPRFAASDKPKKSWKGYEYNFNPCISFTLGNPMARSDCQFDNDVAVCQSHLRYHRRIGKQSSVKFGHYKHTNIPMLHYCSVENGITWETTVLLKCDTKEEKGDFQVWTDTTPQNVKLNLTHKCACPDACLLNPTTAPSDPTDNIVIDIVTSVAGGFVLVFVLIVIWWRTRIRWRNNDYPPLINGNDGGEVDQIVNEYPDTSEGSELTSGRNSASLTKLPSSGSSCSDITEPKKDQSFNSKVITGASFKFGQCIRRLLQLKNETIENLQLSSLQVC